MAELILSNIICIVLTITAVLLTFVSGDTSLNTVSPYMLLLLGGIMMILITSGHYIDGRKKGFQIMEVLTAVFFAFLSGNWFGFIIFSCIPFNRIKRTVLFADLAFIVFAFANVFRNGFSGEGLAYSLIYLMALTVIILFISVIKLLIERSKNRRNKDLEMIRNYSLREMHEIKKNQELTQQNFYAEKNARLVERENISRNIHNNVGHSITAAIMTLDAADMLFDKKPEEAHKRMNDANDRIRGSLEAIRSAVRALDSEDEEVSVKDLICYSDNIIDDFLMDTEFTCDKVYDFYSEDIQISKVHVEFLTGALSEMLTNGVKHGSATYFMIKLTGDSSHIKLEVKDNGSSDFNDDNSAKLIRDGFGVRKMIAYADRCGGSSEFRNDSGFYSMIELPVK